MVMENTPLVMLVVINYNGKSYLKECFSSIFAQTYSNFRVAMVDNGSEDNSVQFIKDNFPKVLIIESNKNLGYAGAINKAIKFGFGLNGDFEYFGILNNDISLDKRWLEKLIGYGERNKNVGVLGSKFLMYHWPKYINSTGICVNYFGYSWDRDFFELDYNCGTKSGQVIAVSGGAVLIKKEVFEKIGLFDEEYFMYYEDLDFCYRVWGDTNFSVNFVEDAIAYHKFSGSLGIFSIKKHFYLKRSRYIFILKNYPLSFIIKIFPQISGYEFNKIIWPLIKRLDFANFFREFYIYLIFLFKLPLLFIKRIVSYKRNRFKNKDYWQMVHPSKSKSIKKDIPGEYLDLAKGHFEKYGSKTNRVVMGLNDFGIEKGWSNLISSIPRGRYMFKKASCKLMSPFRRDCKKYYIQIHYLLNDRLKDNLEVVMGEYRKVFEINYGWNTIIEEIPFEILRRKEVNVILKLCGNKNNSFKDLFINEISLLDEKSLFLRRLQYNVA